MSNVLIALGIMGGLGLFFGALLAVAARVLHVQEDPRIEAVEEMLPGSNCGACASPGCRAFAERVVSGDAAPSSCTVSSADGITNIAKYLGVSAGEAVKRVARLHCGGGAGLAQQLAAYDGLKSCRAAALVGGGGKGCTWGCLGLADCDVACTFDAIHMNERGLPVVDVDKCTACGDCVDACPRNLFEILPLGHQLLVQCKAPLEAEAARGVCDVACDACGRCAMDAPEGLVRMENNLPVVDYGRGGPATPTIVARCPTGAIQWLEGGQFGVQGVATPIREPVLSTRRSDVLPD